MACRYCIGNDAKIEACTLGDRHPFSGGRDLHRTQHVDHQFVHSARTDRSEVENALSERAEQTARRLQVVRVGADQ